MYTAMEDFKETLKAAKYVSTPIVVVQTADPSSTMHLIGHELFASEEQYPMLYWDVVQGFKAFNDAGKPVAQQLLSERQNFSGSQQALTKLYALANTKELQKGTIVFFANAHRYINDTQGIQAIFNLRDCFAEENLTLVLLTLPGARVPPELVDHTLVLEEPLPTREDLRKVVEDMVQDTRSQNDKMPDVPVAQLEQATDGLIGLTVFAAQQTTAMSLSLQGLNLQRLWTRKVKLIEQTPGLSVWQGGETFADIRGVDNIREYLELNLKSDEPPGAIVFLDEIDKQVAGHGTDSSGVKTEMNGTLLTWMQDKGAQGVIFLGPPGTAKSLTAKASGNLIGRPTIPFNLTAMQGSLVGQSGQNLRTALQVVDAVSQGRPLFIATCNSISALPPELRRRFKLGTFFFDLPDESARQLIWELYLRKYNLSGEPPNDTDWSGDDIMNCCRNAFRMKIPLQRAAEYIVPVGISAREEIRQLRQQASHKYIDAAKPGVYVFDDNAAQLQSSRGARTMKLASS
jgi:hypothetical protein